MCHSALGLSDYQYLSAFRQLFTTKALKQAVACRGGSPRNRILPLWLLLALTITWFWAPNEKLPFLLRWFRKTQKGLPSAPAVYRARMRLGWAPLCWLRKRVVRPLAAIASDPAAFHHGRRLLAVDGTTFTVADTHANERAFGRPKNQHRSGGYPLIRAVALCELGTHALVAWVARGYDRSEVYLARRLLGRVPSDARLLADRNFHSFGLWQAARAGDFRLLIRVQNGPKFPVDRVLPDGSYLSRVLPHRGPQKAARAIVVRVVVYGWTDATGRVRESRLVTDLLDPATDPAEELVARYHKRWEEELVFGELKSQLSARVTHVRAHDPVRALAELDGLLLGHWVLRWVILQSAREANVPAVSVSFVGALRVLRVRLIRIPVRKKAWARWWEDTLQEIGEQRLQKRGSRLCPRARKTTLSHWPTRKKNQKEGTIPVLRVVPQTKP